MRWPQARPIAGAVALAAALIVAGAVAARAQAPERSENRTISPPRIEIGGGFGGLVLPCLGGGALLFRSDLTIDMELQTPIPEQGAVPSFFVIVKRAGDWVDAEFISRAYAHPPFSARGAVLEICGGCEHGRLEIASLAVVRQ